MIHSPLHVVADASGRLAGGDVVMVRKHGQSAAKSGRALFALCLLLSGSQLGALSGLQESGRALELRSLTVPQSKLPAGCGLMSRDEVAPFRKEGNRIISTGRVQPPGVLDNPWFGNQQSVLGYLQKMFGVARVSPDAPLSAQERNLSLTRGAIEGYSAAYKAAGEDATVVTAIRVQSASPSAAGIRLGDGTILALVIAGSGPCATAVKTFVEGLAK